MHYRLLQKKMGINPILTSELELSADIVDFTNSTGGKDCFYLLSHTEIFILENNEIRSFGNFTFNHATSIQWHKGMGSLFVADNGGRNLIHISEERQKPRQHFSTIDTKILKMALRKLDNNILAITRIDEQGNVYCMVKEASKIFGKFGSSNIRSLVGSGFATYAQSNNLNCCAFNLPNSIDVSSNGLFIADTGNHVIRQLRNGSIKTILGNPTKSDINPTQVVATKDILFYLSNNVYTSNLSSPTHTGMSVYVPNGKIIMTGGQGCVWLLEKYG